VTPSPITPGAVSDTGPVHYLLQIGQIELLPRLLGRVWAPGAAIVELTDQAAPHHVRSWVAQAPDWFLVTEPSSSLGPAGGAGERAAIALARERKLPLLCDDEAARRIARRVGLLVSGTLGVLQQAHARRMIEIVPVMERLLRSTNLYLSETLAPRITKVSVGSNPWVREPLRHNLATICERYGGGGHPKVGAISFPIGAVEEARQAAAEIREELKS